jgi:hypothetical protein
MSPDVRTNPLHRNLKPVPRPRFDDGRSPALLAGILGDSSTSRHYIVLQLGSAVQFRWDAAEPSLEVGMSAESVPMPRDVGRDLPPGWVVTSFDREIDGNAIRTVIRLGRPQAAAPLVAAA